MGVVAGFDGLVEWDFVGFGFVDDERGSEFDFAGGEGYCAVVGEFAFVGVYYVVGFVVV